MFSCYLEALSTKPEAYETYLLKFFNAPYIVDPSEENKNKAEEIVSKASGILKAYKDTKIIKIFYEDDMRYSKIIFKTKKEHLTNIAKLEFSLFGVTCSILDFKTGKVLYAKGGRN